MKIVLILFTAFLIETVCAQSDFPSFLQGTWKMENEDIYEHWDQLNDHTLKGFSYKIKDGKMTISEYLEVVGTKKEVIYTAFVTGQNQGKGIDFALTRADSVFTFENPNHDFPKKIVYRLLTDRQIAVEVSGENQQGFGYKMEKQNGDFFETDSTVSNPDYDPALAQKLGADDYGMKNYILVMLKTGSNQTTDKTFVSKSFRGHLENINRLVAQGKLIVAGPLDKNEKNYRGIFILDNTANFEEAKELLKTDPAIQGGLLDAELYNWYGSAALAEYLEFSDKH